jgi:hypothetical protein
MERRAGMVLRTIEPQTDVMAALLETPMPTSSGEDDTLAGEKLREMGDTVGPPG